jgi:hypothetical protein
MQSGPIQTQDESPLAYVRKYSTSNNQYLQQAALLYSATTDVITLEIARGPSSPTAYLGALISAFEQLMSQGGKDQYKLGGIAFLISKIIPKVASAVLQKLFERLANLFISTLKRFADVAFLAKVLLQCISVCLRHLPSKLVETSTTSHKMVQALFVFSVDPRPKIRKPAQLATERVFRTFSTNSINFVVPKPFEKALIDFCGMEFEVTDSSTKDCTAALHLCGLLKKVLYCVSTSGIAAIIAPLLQLTAQGNPFLLLQTFETLNSLYSKGFEFSTCLLVLQQSLSNSQSTPTFLKDFSNNLSLTTAQQATVINKDVEFSYQLLLSVLDLKPNAQDVSGNRSFNTLITSMYRVLYSFEPQRAMTKLVDIFDTLTETLSTASKSQITSSCLLTIKHLITITLSSSRLDNDIKNTDVSLVSKQIPSTAAVLVYIRQLFMLAQLQQTDFLTILDIIKASMTHAKTKHFSLFQELIIIIETYHAKTHGDDTIQTACEDVIGFAIEKFGPELINTILPLNLPTLANITSDNTVVNQLKSSRIWLLQLYPKHVRNSTLKFFLKELIPITNDCFQLAEKSKLEKRSQEYSFLSNIITFIWESFPAFCLLPQDVVTNFKPLMKELVVYFNSDQFGPICQQPISKGLRNICAKNLAIVNGCWGKHDDLGLQRYSLDDDDLVMLHTPQQLKVYLNRRDKKVNNNGEDNGSDSDDDDDDSDDENNGNDDNDADNDDDDGVDDDDHDDYGLYNQTTSAARKRANNRLYNKGSMLVPPISIQEAQANCDAIGAISKNILPLLFNTLTNTFRDNMSLNEEQSLFIPVVLDTILAYTCTAPMKARETFFTTAFQQFLQVSQEITKIYNAIDDFEDDGEEMPSFDSSMSRPRITDVILPIRKCRALSDILVAMSPALSDECISLFLQSILVNFNSPSDVLQKKAYTTVHSLITINNTLFDKHWKNVLISISSSASNVQAIAQRVRLSLCRSLYSHLQSPLEHKEVLSTLPSLLSEVILATKEPNNKLRIAALDLSIAIGINIYNSGLSVKQQQQQQQQTPDGALTGTKNQTGQALLTQYLTMVLAGLAATTPRMLSATINVLARLVFEFKAVLPAAIVHDIFQTVLILLPSKSREILKAILEFVKVTIVTLPIDILRQHIKELLFSLSEWRPQEKSHFKRKVRVLYQLLIKKFGLEFMRQNTPSDDLRLVEYLRKQQIRQQNQKERERKENEAESKSDGKTVDVFGKGKKTTANADDGEDDFIDVHRYHSGLSFDEIVQMDDGDADSGLGFSAADMLEKSVNKSQKGSKKSSKYDDDELVSINDNVDFLQGNIASKLRHKLVGGGMDDVVDTKSSGVKRKSTQGLAVVNDDGKLDFTSLEQRIIDQERDERLAARKPTPADIANDKKKRKVMAEQHMDEKYETHRTQNKAKLGAEFTSQFGSGDVKRRGVKFDPYAYVPLDPRTLNTKKLSLRQQSKHFSAMFENNANKGGTAGMVALGHRLKRSQRAALKKKGGKYPKAKNMMEDE